MDEETLISMAFAPAKVRRALEMSNGDGEVALELLLSDLVDVDPAPQQARPPPPPAVAVSPASATKAQKAPREPKKEETGGTADLLFDSPSLSSSLPAPSSSSSKPKRGTFNSSNSVTSSSSSGGRQSKVVSPPAPSSDFDEDRIADVEGLYTLLDSLGLDRRNTLLDPDLLDYLIDLSGASADSSSAESDKLEMLQQFMPDLTEPSAALTVLLHLRSLATKKADMLHVQKSSASASSSSTSKATQKLDKVLFEIHQGHLRPKDMMLSRHINEVMAEIRENYPELMFYVSEPIVEFVYLYLGNRNVRETLAYVQTNCNSDEGKEELEARIELRKRKDEEEEERKKANTRLVVEKFDEVEVRPKYDSKGNPIGPKKELVLFLDKAASDGRHTRFRDGIAVSSNGAKYIVEKDPRDDYDGGSRGKVKSKGKRGVGWTA